MLEHLPTDSTIGCGNRVYTKTEDNEWQFTSKVLGEQRMSNQELSLEYGEGAENSKYGEFLNVLSVPDEAVVAKKATEKKQAAEAEKKRIEEKKAKNFAERKKPEDYTAEIRKLSNKDDYQKVEQVIDSLPVGTKVEHGLREYEKISDEEWQYQDTLCGRWETISNSALFQKNGTGPDNASLEDCLIKVKSVPDSFVDSIVSEKSKEDERARKAAEENRKKEAELRKRISDTVPKSLETIEKAYREHAKKDGGLTENNTDVSYGSVVVNPMFYSNPAGCLATDLGIDKSRARKYFDAVRNYTLNSQYFRESFMKQVDGDPAAKSAFDLEDFIRTSPKYTEPIYRGISVSKEIADSIMDNVKKGKPISQNGPSSWTVDFDVAQKFANDNAGDIKIIFHDEAPKHGVNITGASYYPDEQEILVSGFAKHKCSVESVHDNVITLSCKDVTDEKNLTEMPNHLHKSKKTDAADTDYGVGVLVVQDGRFLCGTRLKGGSVGGPGGHIEVGESPEDAAIRETQEEFGITPKDLMPVAFLSDLKPPYCPSHVFLCTDFDGSIRCADGEMTSPGFITAEKVTELSTQNPERLFPPFAQSITALLDVLSSNPGLTSDAQNAKMKDRMDFNEADHPRDENGQFAEGKGSSSGSTESGPAVSPEGENVPCTGFASPARLEDHATRHGLAEMGFATKEEYQQKGIDFLKQPCGGDVIGYARPDGVVVRFNTKTTEYATGVPGGPLKTYMKAKCNRKTGEARPEVAMKYYEFNREKDLKEVDDEQGS